jgi:hypothetical protein
MHLARHVLGCASVNARDAAILSCRQQLAKQLKIHNALRNTKLACKQDGWQTSGWMPIAQKSRGSSLINLVCASPTCYASAQTVEDKKKQRAINITPVLAITRREATFAAQPAAAAAANGDAQSDAGAGARHGSTTPAASAADRSASSASHSAAALGGVPGWAPVSGTDSTAPPGPAPGASRRCSRPDNRCWASELRERTWAAPRSPAAASQLCGSHFVLLLLCQVSQCLHTSPVPSWLCTTGANELYTLLCF